MGMRGYSHGDLQLIIHLHVFDLMQMERFNLFLLEENYLINAPRSVMQQLKEGLEKKLMAKNMILDTF